MGFLYSLCNCLDIKRIKATSSVATAGGDENNDKSILEGYDLLFDMQSLQVATGSFSESNLLGHGGFGSVYKVHLIWWLMFMSYLVLNLWQLPQYTVLNISEIVCSSHNCVYLCW